MSFHNEIAFDTEIREDLAVLGWLFGRAALRHYTRLHGPRP